MPTTAASNSNEMAFKDRSATTKAAGPEEAAAECQPIAKVERWVTPETTWEFDVMGDLNRHSMIDSRMEDTGFQ